MVTRRQSHTGRWLGTATGLFLLLACCPLVGAASLLAIIEACHDGDTCTVTIPNIPEVFGASVPVRLAGVDAPELKGQCQSERDAAKAAQLYMRDHLKVGDTVMLLHPGRDKYFRVLADIQHGTWIASTGLLEAGLARAYSGGTKQSWCP